MPMYNLLEYSKNYRKTTGSLWNYYRDEPYNSVLNDDDPLTINYNADPIKNYFLLNTKVILLEKHQMRIEKTVKTASEKTQKLKKILKLLFY